MAYTLDTQHRRIAPTIAVRPAYQAFLILYAGYTVLPIVAGVDKFFYLLASWDIYLAPSVVQMLPVSAHTFMMATGVIEILAGLCVALWPRVGGVVVGLWLLGIVGNLLLSGGYYDIALRDFGLALGAFTLARLSGEFGGAVREEP